MNPTHLTESRRAGPGHVCRRIYYIRLDPGQRLAAVVGYPVPIPGWPSLDAFCQREGKFWRLCDATTGTRLPGIGRSKPAAVKDFMVRANTYKYTPESIARKSADILDTFGPLPASRPCSRTEAKLIDPTT